MQLEANQAYTWIEQKKSSYLIKDRFDWHYQASVPFLLTSAVDKSQQDRFKSSQLLIKNFSGLWVSSNLGSQVHEGNELLLLQRWAHTGKWDLWA